MKQFEYKILELDAIPTVFKSWQQTHNYLGTKKLPHPVTVGNDFDPDDYTWQKEITITADLLNELGQQGWELCSFIKYNSDRCTHPLRGTYLFKKEIL